MANTLTVGQQAPDFSLQDANGQTHSKADLAGKRFILYFYPKAATPGCTTEACDFTEKLEDFNNASVTVLGISPDPTDKLADFRAKHDLGIELLGDESKDTLIAYGAFGEKKMYGKVTEGVIRSTFVVDVDAAGQGTVAVAQYDVRAAGHVDKLRRELRL